jgi:hypothetical protein
MGCALAWGSATPLVALVAAAPAGARTLEAYALGQQRVLPDASLQPYAPPAALRVQRGRAIRVLLRFAGGALQAREGARDWDVRASRQTGALLVEVPRDAALGAQTLDLTVDGPPEHWLLPVVVGRRSHVGGAAVQPFGPRQLVLRHGDEAIRPVGGPGCHTDPFTGPGVPQAGLCELRPFAPVATLPGLRAGPHARLAAQFGVPITFITASLGGRGLQPWPLDETRTLWRVLVPDDMPRGRHRLRVTMRYPQGDAAWDAAVTVHR